ncbi:MAG: hypothetical protein A2X56_14445 [Nitrospirae bacterium GWC2_57_13]|jgi:uncharacterized membrane protein|nr:MAG: hypothetical protein A2X56_14445 [Nitrospirae bacterium GWC2_57_13]HAR45305.1 DUF2318 domain-containing protein [Nitrospiraceae bacterium]
MRVCTKCGQEIDAEASFCKACGKGMKKGAPGALEGKRARVKAGEKKWMRSGIIAVAVLFAAFAAWVIYDTVGKEHELLSTKTATAGPWSGPTYVPVKAEDGLVRIPVADIAGGAVRYYVYSAEGKAVKFFLLRAQDGSLRSALDACQACYRAKLGYKQEGDKFICKNCNMAFPKDGIGIRSGGCNPIPLPTKTDANMIVIKAKDLEAGAKYF